ncbi:MAG: putative Ig domain-containing protein [Candidatus Omnitrophica bacterium]|nr:putative Ig domain-containing protein [Candidatus Omnitrophota bacterium]
MQDVGLRIRRMIFVFGASYFFIALSAAQAQTDIQINGGAARTDTPIVTLTLNHPSAFSMKISNVNPQDWGAIYEEPYVSSKSWVLSAGLNGPRTVYVKFREGSERWSGPYEDTIELEAPVTSMPHTAMLINNGDLFTDMTEVTLTFDPRNAGRQVSDCAYIELSNDYSNWQRFPYSYSLKWNLVPPDGEKTVWARFLNRQGIILTEASASIELAQGLPAKKEVWVAPDVPTNHDPSLPLGSSPRNPFVTKNATEFDNLMRSLAEDPHNSTYVTVHLAEGEYETRGYNTIDEIIASTNDPRYPPDSGCTRADHKKNFWKFKEGWKIIGAGIDRTILRLIDARRYGDLLAQYVVLRGEGDYCQVSGMTLDCNSYAFIQQTGSQVRTVMGLIITAPKGHLRARNLKVVGASAGFPKAESFPIGLGTRTNNQGDVLIENCMVSEPVEPREVSMISMISGGLGIKNPDGSIVYARGCVVRNCTFDGTIQGTDVAAKKSQIGSLSAYEGVHENNRGINLSNGFYFDTYRRHNMIIRNNLLSNVKVGVQLHLEGIDTAQSPESILDGCAIIEHNLIELDPAYKSGYGLLAYGFLPAPPYNLEQIIMRNNIFRFTNNQNPPPTTRAAMAHIVSIHNARLENNISHLNKPQQITWHNFHNVLDKQSDVVNHNEPTPLVCINNRNGSGQLLEPYVPVIEKESPIVVEEGKEASLVIDQFLDDHGNPLPTVAENLPERAVFDGYVFRWRPGPHQAGRYIVSFRDSQGLRESRNYLIDVRNRIMGSSSQYFSDGLLAYWKFDEQSGSPQFTDSSGNNHHILINASSATLPQVGVAGIGGNGAIQFSGVEYLWVLPANKNVFKDTRSFSIAFWFKLLSWEEGRYIKYILYSGSGASGFRIALIKNGDFIKPLFWSSDSGGDIKVSTLENINVGQWHHLVCTYDGISARIYLDGAPTILSWRPWDFLGAFPCGKIIPSNGNLILSSSNGSMSFSNGLLDELAFWNRALNENEVAEIYAQQLSGATIPLVPASPTHLSSRRISNSQVELTWQDNSTNETNFILERRLDAGAFSEIAVLDKDTTVHIDTISGLTGRVSYRVRSRNQNGSSAPSNEVWLLANLYTLNVTDGSGSGIYRQGQVVMVTAAPPQAGYHFEKWTGDVPAGQQPTNTSLSVVMDRNKTLSANYAINTYVLRVDGGSGSGTYTHGQTATVTATDASDDYLFVRWSGDVPAGQSASNPLSIIMDSDKTIRAEYNNRPVLQPIGNKTIREGQTLNIQVEGSDDETGDEITFFYASDNLPDNARWDAATHTFSWTPTANQSGSYTVTFGVSDQLEARDIETITITVLDARYRLTINKQGEGVVSPGVGSYTFDLGQRVTIAATAAEGYFFAGFLGCSPVTSNLRGGTAELVMDSDKSVTTLFKALPSVSIVSPAQGYYKRDVAITLNAQGGISPEYYYEVDFGDDTQKYVSSTLEGQQKQIIHKYNRSGTFAIRAKVKDALGQVSKESYGKITIVPEPGPRITFVWPTQGAIVPAGRIQVTASIGEGGTAPYRVICQTIYEDKWYGGDMFRIYPLQERQINGTLSLYKRGKYTIKIMVADAQDRYSLENVTFMVQ